MTLLVVPVAMAEPDAWSEESVREAESDSQSASWLVFRSRYTKVPTS